jgi:hypothetical protein
MMYGFMGIRAIEIVKMASQKKLTQEKVVWTQTPSIPKFSSRTGVFPRGLVFLSDNFFWGQFFFFFWEAFSPISMAHIPMKPYIIREVIE